MADFAASVLAQVVESGVKYVVGVIKHQFIYLCCFVSNIAALRVEAHNLDDVANEMQAQVNAAENDVQKIKPEILTWLRATDDIKEKTTRILNEVPNVENGCLALKARFSLSRSVVKTREATKLHREKGKLFGYDISMAPSSAASKPTPLGITYHEFGSRRQIEQEILIALRGEEENMIGICGMGGIGKTTMAKRIMNKALEDRIFQEVVIVVVSQTADELKIQVEIGGSLGLKGLERESQQARVQKLYERLTSSTKRTLLILDDVWKNIKLSDLGIPRGGDSKGCRILITSRNGDVLKAMGVKKVFGLKELSIEEAWFLFKENAGTCVENKGLNSIAKQVVSKCKGLPIAIEIVGASLKEEWSKSVWKDSLKQLMEPNPENTPDFIADVYKPLIVSYDKLDNDEVKSLFLLCCLFPEDGDIPLEKLVFFCMGLCIFKYMRSVEDVRDRVCALVKRLKTRSLLLDSEKEDCVRMHDVVRDIGIFTRKQKEKSGWNNGSWISSSELLETSEARLLNLHLLLSTNDNIKIENLSSERMRQLYVLAVENHSWTSLPPTLEQCPNIRTFILDSCKYLQKLSGVGRLVNLEILICRDCYKIRELPHEVRLLKNLKVLDISGCHMIKGIAPGIISSLVGLEELKMLGSCDDWGKTDNDREYKLLLRELESLTKLTCLEIKIKNHKLVSQQIKLSTNIKRFHIRFGYSTLTNFPEECNKKLFLKLKRGIRIGHWVEKLIKDTECLYIKGNGANDLDLAKFSPNIRYLKLDSCESMKNIIDGIGDDGRHDLFQHMEGLELSCLPQLHEIWTSSVSSNTFQNIKTISLEDLPALQVLWRTSSMGYNERSYSLFPYIECLELSSLPLLQEVWNGPVSSNSFKNLKKLHINDLQALKQLGKSSSGAVSLPQLQSLRIEGCGMMEQLFQYWSEEEEGENAADIDQHKYLHLFCQPQKVSFGGLKNFVTDRNPFCRHLDASAFNQLEELCISKCDGNSSLFTPSMARNLTNLRKLSIIGCDEMVQVIKGENDDDKAAVDGGRLFPRLLEIQLRNLSNLVTFWKCDAGHELPLLKELIIYKCPKMTKFTLESITTPLLKYVLIDNGKFKINASTDLDGILLTLQKVELKKMEMEMWMEMEKEMEIWIEMEQWFEMEKWTEMEFWMEMEKWIWKPNKLMRNKINEEKSMEMDMWMEMELETKTWMEMELEMEK